MNWIRLPIFSLFFLLIVGCSESRTQKNSLEQKPIVLVSVAPYLDFVKKIAGDSVVPIPMIPIGANPHLYEPSIKEVEKHQNAALWIYLGESFDKKIYAYFQERGHPIEVVKLAEGLPLIGEERGHCHCHDHEETLDLHIWLSPKLAQIQAEKIAEGLIKILPKETQRFTANLEKLKEELQGIDRQITQTLSEKKGSAILVSHPAFGYFCKDYELVQLSIEVEGKDPLPQHITAILKQAKQLNLQSIILQPQYSNKGAERVAETLGMPTQMIDPYAEDSFQTLLNLADAIADLP